MGTTWGTMREQGKKAGASLSVCISTLVPFYHTPQRPTLYAQSECSSARSMMECDRSWLLPALLYRSSSAASTRPSRVKPTL